MWPSFLPKAETKAATMLNLALHRFRVADPSVALTLTHFCPQAQIQPHTTRTLFCRFQVKCIFSPISHACYAMSEHATEAFSLIKGGKESVKCHQCCTATYASNVFISSVKYPQQVFISEHRSKSYCKHPLPCQTWSLALNRQQGSHMFSLIPL